MTERETAATLAWLRDALLVKQGRAVTVRELVGLTGRPECDVRQALGIARRSGQVVQLGRSPTGSSLFVERGGDTPR